MSGADEARDPSVSARVPLLRARDLGVRFDEVVALAGLDLELQRGSCVAVVGHNGCGKSTLVRCLGGQVAPTAGHLEVDGRDPAEDPDRTARLRAVVPDPAVTDEDRTVREQLAAVATAHGLGPAVDGAVTTTLEAFGLTSRLEARPHQLSLGLRQRAQLATAFVRPAELLLLDEPTQYLDVAATEALVERLFDAMARGAGIVLTSHDPELARAVADEVLVLEDGRPVDRGAPQTVLSGAAAERAGLVLPRP
jgi:ABC-2 type transport system ATP-binding protein